MRCHTCSVPRVLEPEDVSSDSEEEEKEHPKKRARATPSTRVTRAKSAAGKAPESSRSSRGKKTDKNVALAKQLFSDLSKSGTYSSPNIVQTEVSKGQRALSTPQSKAGNFPIAQANPPLDTNFSAWLLNLRQLVHGPSSEVTKVEEEEILPTEANAEEVQRAQAILESLKPLNLESVLDPDTSKNLQDSISILLSDKVRTPGRSFALYKIKEQFSLLSSDSEQVQSDIDEANQLFSSKEALHFELGQRTKRFDSLQTVESECDRELGALAEKIKQLQAQYKAVEEVKAKNSIVMVKLFKETKEKGELFAQYCRDEPKWNLKKRRTEKKLERMEQEWEERKKEFPTFNTTEEREEEEEANRTNEKEEGKKKENGGESEETDQKIEEPAEASNRTTADQLGDILIE